jgi:hypothetical protein
MDTTTALVLLPLLVTGFIALGWFNWQRQVAKTDSADEKKQQEVDARLKALEDKNAELRLEIEKRITRDELDKVFAAVADVRRQVEAQGQETVKVLATLVASLSRGGGEHHG